MKTIRDLRKQRKITAKQLGQIINVAESTMCMYENGKRRPDYNTLKKLADYFGVSVDYLIGRSEEKYPAPTLSEENALFPVIGDIAAGYDHIVLDDWDGEVVELPISYLKGRARESFMVLRVKGESMYPMYCDGDRVLILKQNTVDYSGQVAAVIYDDDLATLKRVEYTGGETLRLIAVNPNVPPIRLEGERLNHCRIIGIPKILIRDIED